MDADKAKVAELIVIELVAEHFDRPISEIKLDTNFELDLGGDSLDAVELVMAFEDKTGVFVDDEDIERSNIVTVQDFINFAAVQLKEVA